MAWRQIGLLAIWFSLVGIVRAEELVPCRVAIHQGKTRVVFETSKKMEVKLISSKGVKIVFPMKIRLKQVDFSDTLVQRITTQGQWCQIDYCKEVEIHFFQLTNPERLVIDAVPADELGKLLANFEKGTTFSNRQEKKILSLTESNKVKFFRVVLDAGHGGKDPGAIGVHGSREKDLNLSVVKKIYRYLTMEKDLLVFLTRNEDCYLPLRKRLKVARDYQADLFVSIHADAYFNSQAQGASIFALSAGGATSEVARWLAQKENESELGRELLDKDLMVRSVLLDLAQSATIRASLSAGKAIFQQLELLTKLHSNSVEQAAFVVLKAPEIPSLLIEVGFISNKEEEKKLRDSRYQEQLAYRIARGIINYLKSTK